MLGSALLPGEDLEGLILGAYLGELLARVLQGELSVCFSMSKQKKAFNFASHAL